ncbi:CTP synthase [Caldivirga sp. UBA161]|uniref:CTP synthase n=1 Tax=Caldivirga sp. UBA161 TaxID=1915569 RepID=UPI0025BFCF38|nr:CTP synthase [Caldivirga sp. UBA161]
MTAFIFITGGVMSSVGKGIATASIAKILQARGLSVTAIKVDPYLNVDAGTMNPYQHGEVYVTADGGETDLDLGHYERFLDVELSKSHNITSGQVYLSVIDGERRGVYLGQTVQLIPHVTNEVKARIRNIAKEGWDAVVIEIGGTVGDYESLPFLEAARQMRLEENGNVVFIHVAPVPILDVTDEFKTKPLQHSVMELRRVGIQPDIIIIRSTKPITSDVKAKVSLFTNVPQDLIFNSFNVDTIYRVPLILDEQGLGNMLAKLLKVKVSEPKWDEWVNLVNAMINATEEVSVTLCGKYVKLRDAYISIVEAIKHAAAWLRVRPRIIWCDSEEVERDPDLLAKMNTDSYIILPGFGARGVEGKIMAIKYARENNIPILGICYGMQLSVVEYARDVLGLKDAHTTEVNPNTPHPVIDITPEEKNVNKLGGTMILGDREISIAEGSILHEVYGSLRIRERHRHRYEVNPAYFKQLQEAGLVFSAMRVDVPRVEAIELHNHYFFIATQFHPEFRSRLTRPHPLFITLLKAALSWRRGEPSPYTGVTPH